MKSMVFFMMLISVSALAGVQKIPLKQQANVKIALGNANVVLSQAKDRELTLSTSDNCPVTFMEMTETEVFIREKDLLKTRSEARDCQVQILMPSQNLNLHVLNGSITAQRLSSDLFLHVQKGKITLREASGASFLHVQRGDVLVNDCQGSVRLDLQQASAKVQNLQGDLDLQSLSGDHLIERPKGHLRVTLAQGSLKVIGGQGVLQVESARAQLNSQNFAGRIEGRLQDGSAQLTLAADPDVNLKSKTAKIYLTASAGSGAFVNLVTQEGDLFGPPGLAVTRSGGNKKIVGRMRGEAGRGSIVVSSDEGTITLK